MSSVRPHRRANRPGRGILAACLFFAASLATTAAEFPRFEDLPARPEMPDPLVMLDGTPVTTPEQWTTRRRPELKALFQHYMYGRMPPRPADETFAVAREDPGFLGGMATLKEVTITLGPPEVTRIYLLVVVPNARDGPAPVFLGVNFRGNHAVVADPKVALPVPWVPGIPEGEGRARALEAGRGKEADVWAVDDVIHRGYAFATYYCGDTAPDHKGVVDGVRPFFLEGGRTRPGPHDWGAIAAWAWGLSRSIDYLETDEDIDRARIAAVGWSRMGKASILAAAFDERIALAIPHQAGCGGTAPSRARVGETVRRINAGNPHWFDDEFKNFNDRPEKLPFDQNALVALVAPRAVLFTNAVLDEGANPEGQFQVLRSADPAYRLLGAGGLDAERMPGINTLVASRLGFHIRPGTHSMGREDWAVFLDYADAQFGRPKGR